MSTQKIAEVLSSLLPKTPTAREVCNRSRVLLEFNGSDTLDHKQVGDRL